MPSVLTIAVAQPPTAVGDVAANARAHAAAVAAAAARLVAFPELSLTGYDLSAAALDPADARLAPLVAACRRAGATALAGAPVQDAEGREHIATLAIDGRGARIAYRKRWLGGEEAARFVPGERDAALELEDGWRIALGVCRDTGTPEHVEAVAALRPDLYVAGLVHHPHELDEQERRGRTIAARIAAPVALASAAGPAGPSYPAGAGRSAVWAAGGRRLARAGAEPGALARAVLPHPPRRRGPADRG